MLLDAFELCCWRRLLRVPWTARRSNQSIPKGDQSWVFIGRTDAEAETPVLWPSHVKSWLIGKDSDAGRDWGQEEKRTTEDEMAGWHHWLDGRESEWTPEVGDGQGGLVCCSSWGHNESDTTEWLSWTDVNILSLPLWFINLHTGEISYQLYSRSVWLEGALMMCDDRLVFLEALS